MSETTITRPAINFHHGKYLFLRQTKQTGAQFSRFVTYVETWHFLGYWTKIDATNWRIG